MSSSSCAVAVTRPSGQRQSGCGLTPILLELQSIWPAPYKGGHHPFIRTITARTKARMLRGIHKASSTWLGKAIMGVIMGGLIVSFAIWGIGDIFRGFGANSVAKIGGTEISIEQFRQYYTEQLQRVSRQVGRPISPDQARAAGIDRRYSANWWRAPSEEHAKKLGWACPMRTSRSASTMRISAVRTASRPPLCAGDPQRHFTEGRYVTEQRRTCCCASDRAECQRRHPCRRRCSPRSTNSEREAHHRIYRADRRAAAIFRPPRRSNSANISKSARSCSVRRNTASSRCCR